MPYEQEHSCRLKPPNAFQPDSFRRTKRKHEGKEYSVIMGRLKGETTMTEQAYRYDKETWTASEAGSHCRSHDGTFEAAKKESTMQILVKSGDIYELMKEPDLIELFRKSIDDDGNVQRDIIVFTEAIFKQEPADDSIRWTLSDYSLDRDLERIDPAGWDLKYFKENPIVLWAHDYMRPAIGKVIQPRVKEGKLTGKLQFSAKEVDEFGWMIGQKVREGILTTGSVGFKSQKVEVITNEDKKEPARLIHRKQELYEFSIVNIASNPNARVERQVQTAEVDDDKTVNRDDDIERMESEIADLHKRIANLEKHNSKSYIGTLLNLERETSARPTRETSEMDEMFRSDLEEIF